jgi:hypothetical protein
MSDNFCYCGLKAHARCTRCNASLCYAHYNIQQRRSAWNWGQGETLAKAAYMRGSGSAPRDPFTCKNCRDTYGKQHASTVLQRSNEWPQEPFHFALKAASLGYVITKPGINYAQVIRSWLDLKWQPVETVTFRRLVRPEKRKQRGGRDVVTRPAEYAHDNHKGWSFPRTIHQSMGRSTPQVDDVWEWAGTTNILTDGRVFQAGHPATQPLSGATYRLIVEMARKMHISRGWEWKGPAENWGT